MPANSRKKRDEREAKIRKESERYRSALEGLTKALAFPDNDIRREAAIQQAFDAARGALGGDEWSDWGNWQEGSVDGLEQLKAAQGRVAPEKIFFNNLFEVWVYIEAMVGDHENKQPPIAYLSIKRLDKLPIDYDHWRILQRIKSEILGDETEGIELYPREDRKMDVANQYHLYCLPPGHIWPVGEGERAISSGVLMGADWDDDGGEPHGGYARQRPIHPDERPDDDPYTNPDAVRSMDNIHAILNARREQEGDNEVMIEGLTDKVGKGTPDT